jgi:4a-hydroxytetrahydrobiopterin dehydratase
MTTRRTPLTEPEIRKELDRLPGWRYEGGALSRTYKTNGWPSTLMLVNAIGFLAESLDHHPDLEVHWGSVGIRLSTHSAGGVTPMDVELARQIEETAARGTTRQLVQPS